MCVSRATVEVALSRGLLLGIVLTEVQEDYSDAVVTAFYHCDIDDDGTFLLSLLFSNCAIAVSNPSQHLLQAQSVLVASCGDVHNLC